MMKTAISKVIKNQNLTVDEARQVMDLMLDGGATQVQIGSFLTALRLKGETIDEITGCAMTMKEKASHIRPKVKNYIDFVGTGGDGVNTINISTTAAFVIAGAGVPIAKHGNRAVSSKSGSADVLEALGVNIMLEPDQVEKCVEEIGIGFMFAKVFHKYMKNAAQVRSEMGIRTIFNILGPISNPSDAKRQVIGVYAPNLTCPLASAMRNMGIERGLVVHSRDGMDEFSVSAPTLVSEIKDGTVIDYEVTPQEFGLGMYDIREVVGGTANDNAKITTAVLNGEQGAARDIVLFNAAAGIYAGGIAQTLHEGVEFAKQSIDSGAAMDKLNKLIEMSVEV